jgi:ribosomal protection tetracycline resistance protein
MPRTNLNLGILAHVDAGKTSLTERLLFDNGTISSLGSVDAGNTTTDSSALERERGITIRAAVASFVLGDLQVNLVDTPGHPDFIAEVDRALSVLDCAVLVLSAVEGVQAQTRVLMKSLRRMRLPTILFVNKIDRPGARSEELLRDIRKKLAPCILPMTAVHNIGTAHAQVVQHSLENLEFSTQAVETMADSDDCLLAQIIDGPYPSADGLQELIATRTKDGLIHPVFFGSALRGVGTRELASGIKTFLQRARPPENDTEPRGTVFAIDFAGSGEKIAYLRLFSGELRERQEITLHQREPSGVTKEVGGKITAIEVVGEQGANSGIDEGSKTIHSGRGVLTAGGIGKIRGLPEIRVGAQLGNSNRASPLQYFPPPSLQAIIRPRKISDQTKLHAALVRLADEDPLIQTQPAGNGATSVLLHGEVQKEVIAERLKRDFGVDPIFSESLPVYFERPAGKGEATQIFDPRADNAFWASIGLRVEANTTGEGNRFVREAKWGQMPPGFYYAIEESALQTLNQGLFGWRVTDCNIYLTMVGYERPVSIAAHFRDLTPILVMRALSDAGTRVFEPCNIIEIEVPSDSLGSIIAFLSIRETEITNSEQVTPDSWQITGEIPTRLIQEVQVALPGLSRGEGTLLSYAGSDRQVRGAPPVRMRTDGNPLDYHEYMQFLSRAKSGVAL